MITKHFVAGIALLAVAPLITFCEPDVPLPPAANPPTTTPAPVTPPPKDPVYTHSVVASGTVFMSDDEFWGSDEVKTVPFPNDPSTLTASKKIVQMFEFSECVGDEVVVKVVPTATLVEPGGSIKVSGTARLYESTGCSADDEEDKQDFDFIVGPGALGEARFRLESTGTGGGDYADVYLVVNNQVSAD